MVRMSTFIALVSLRSRISWISADPVPGRTARIGNQGLATSFYSTDDEPMAPFLAKILVESGNQVPDFLQEYKPEDGVPLDFDDNSDVEAEPVQSNGAAEDDSAEEGCGAAPVVAAPVAADNSWGESNATQGNGGW